MGPRFKCLSYRQWRNKQGRGQSAPPETFHWEIFGDLSGKMRQGIGRKMGNVEEIKENRKEKEENEEKLKIEGGK